MNTPNAATFTSHAPLSIFVFGASGDLAKKKTYPALFQLFLQGSLPRNTVICGYARSKLSDEDLGNQVSIFGDGARRRGKFNTDCSYGLFC